MSPVSNAMSLPSWLLLAGLAAFVLFTLGRRRRTAGLLVVGLLGTLFCGALLFTSLRQRQIAVKRHEWSWDAPAARTAPRFAPPRRENKSYLIVELDADELDDEDVEPEEIARLAHVVSGLERDGKLLAPQAFESIEFRAGDEGRRLELKDVARLSRRTTRDPGANEKDLVSVLRFTCPDDPEWLERLQEVVHVGDADFVTSTRNNDHGTLDLVLDSPAARRLNQPHTSVGERIAARTLENLERAVSELHDPALGRAVRAQMQAEEDRRSAEEAARAAAMAAIRDTADAAKDAVNIPVDAVHDVAKEAHAVVESVRVTAEEAIESAPAAATPEAPASPEAPQAAEAPAPIEPPAPALRDVSSTRPVWVDERDSFKKVDGVFRRRVTGGPAGSIEECQQSLEVAIQQAVDAYVDALLEPGASSKLEIAPEYIEQRILKDTYQEKHDLESLDPKLVASETAAGAMLSLHGLLEFDAGVERDIRDAWRDYQVRGRLWAAGISFAGVLGVVGSMFGYLRLDTVTKGYYTGRLMLAAGAAILAVIAATAGALALLIGSGMGPW